MKTTKEKSIESKRKFDTSRRNTVIWTLVQFILLMIMAEIASKTISILFVDSPGYDKIYLVYVIIFGLCLFLFAMFAPLWIRKDEWNMKKTIKELQAELETKREWLTRLEEEKLILDSIPFGEIPPNLKESASQLLQADSPETYLDSVRQDIADREIMLDIYKGAAPTYWKYLFSMEWLRKIH